jgi:MFS family permease
MADSVRVALVDAWLREMSGQEKFGRIFGGVSLTVLGPVAAGLGGWLLLDPQFHTTDSPLFTSVGVIGIGVGLFGLATGIYALSTELMAEDRFARFRESVEGGLDVHELGRFEGELRAYSDAARMARPISIFGGIGFAVGGAVAIGLTAVASDHLDEEAELWGYAFGAGFIAGGALGALLALIETPYEKAWRMYEEGLLPDGSSATTARIDVAPFVSGDGAGVAAAGTF